MDRSEIHINLKPALAKVIQQAVETGEYASQDEIINEAVLEWRLRRELNPTEREALGLLWDEGMASGPGRFESMNAIKQEARRRWTDDQVRRKAEG